jgi:malate dehydrogenase (oxaloacetate-decarboxylating)(NADP+)
MPLSNPTHKAECTFLDAITHTDGNVAFASGSPFEPISFGGKTLYPAQANNAYVFPALGHAAVLADAKEISDDVFLAAAESLAVMTSEEELSSGKLFPDFDAIQETSKTLTAMVCEKLEQTVRGGSRRGSRTGAPTWTASSTARRRKSRRAQSCDDAGGMKYTV